MTEYFEVTDRDGAARRGDLRVTESLQTPALVDSVLRDAGSQWATARTTPEPDPDVLTVLPHRAFPPGTDERVMEAFDETQADLDSPTAAVISPETAGDRGTDAYILSGGPALVGHAEALVTAVIQTRRAIPDDAALMLSGAATPATVPLLAYLGIDLFDTDRAVIRGTQGRYLTTAGDQSLAELREFPCACSVCQANPSEFTREDCADHNVATLRAALRSVREAIREDRLREHVSATVRHEPWQTAAFRRLDEEWAYLSARTPLFRDRTFPATTPEDIRRPEVQRFADRVTERYQARMDDVPLLLVPCSARKPYSESRSHGQFQDAANYRAHVVSMTSPIGVVPTELELTYPAQHYDAAVTGRWSETEIDFVARVLEGYLDATDYPRVVAHVPAEGYRTAIERATAAKNTTVTYTVSEHPTDEDSLTALAEALEGERQIRVSERERATVRAVADYQFGAGAGDRLFADFELQGRHPKLRVDDATGTQLATLVPMYGLLALTLAGAHRWANADVDTRTVDIDAFVPHGSVLAPGVVSADADILVGDEVIVRGPSAFGVGRATMPGPAMTEATRGVAVDVRHVEER